MGESEIPQPTPDDLARPLLADYNAASVTDADLWAWGEDEDHDWIQTAKVGWRAAIRRAAFAEAELGRLRGIVATARADVAAMIEVARGVLKP